MPDSDPSEQKKPSRWYGDAGPFFTLGFQLAGAVVVFFFIGFWIDGKFHSAPFGALAGILFGSIGGFIKFFHTVKQIGKDEEERKKDIR